MNWFIVGDGSLPLKPPIGITELPAPLLGGVCVAQVMVRIAVFSHELDRCLECVKLSGQVL